MRRPGERRNEPGGDHEYPQEFSYNERDLYAGTTPYDGTVAIALGQGYILRASPTRQGNRIGVGASLSLRAKPVLTTTLVVQPGRGGFLIHTTGQQATILAVSVK